MMVRGPPIRTSIKLGLAESRVGRECEGFRFIIRGRKA